MSSQLAKKMPKNSHPKNNNLISWHWVLIEQTHPRVGVTIQWYAMPGETCWVALPKPNTCTTLRRYRSKQKKAWKSYLPSLYNFLLVAGSGFEPLTFGL
jgi:hypothetical protein